jgi:hypothetical protein
VKRKTLNLVVSPDIVGESERAYSFGKDAGDGGKRASDEWLPSAPG